MGGPSPVTRPRRVAVAWILLAVALVVVWEGAKWLFGDPWRIHTALLGLPIDIDHLPPFHSRIATDLSLPHIWLVVTACVDPAQRNRSPLGVILERQTLFTLRDALPGCVLDPPP